MPGTGNFSHLRKRLMGLASGLSTMMMHQSRTKETESILLDVHYLVQFQHLAVVIDVH